MTNEQQRAGRIGPVIDPMKYRRVLGHFPTGVTIITGIDDGRPIGFTIGSFASVSLDPPLVGFLPMISSDRWQEIMLTKAFCVNVLAHDQAELCWQFAKSSVENPFEGVSWTPGAGHRLAACSTGRSPGWTARSRASSTPATTTS